MFMGAFWMLGVTMPIVMYAIIPFLRSAPTAGMTSNTGFQLFSRPSEKDWSTSLVTRGVYVWVA